MTELKRNSLITASYSKWLHADALETVTGRPGLSNPVLQPHVLTAPWKCQIQISIIKLIFSIRYIYYREKFC